MRVMLKKALQAFLVIFALLALPLQGFAQDDTNAAKITQLSLWADMYQVMSGTSSKDTPDTLKFPANLSIRTPTGIYAYVLVDDLTTAAANSGVDQHTAFKNYFAFLLSQQEVAGILFAVPWSLLSPKDPATNPPVWTTLDAAFDAISAWNNSHKNAPGKSLQLNVTAGFNSPPWLFTPKYLTSCDFLFEQLNLITTIPSCGYTTIFAQTEVAAAQKGMHPPLPLPWNATYHKMWKAFLQSLWTHIGDNNWKQYVVSVAIAGPTATSTEIILPSEHDQKDYTPLLLPSGSTNANVDALSAWNCLLANNYGLAAPYLNSDRAFVEEWANAIDMYGEIFSELTLTVTTGNGLPNFNKPPDPENPSLTTLSGCGLLGVTLPDPSNASYLKLSNPQPAFLPDCGSKPLFPMDCAAEVAILAYFAEPPVGGPNAKATQENALSVTDDVVFTLLSLSNASVKWLSQNSDRLVLPGAQPDGALGIPLVSRVMGGLQLQLPATSISNGTVTGTAIGCTGGSSCTAEQSLRNVLDVFFQGTSKAGAFGAPATISNNGTEVKDAPLNYLQIWADDIKNAAIGKCDNSVIMATSSAWTKLSCNTGSKAAKDLLVFASKNIPTTTVLLPLFGYNKCNTLPSCATGYYKRGAFQGDAVCVSKSNRNQADSESKPKIYVPNFSPGLNDSNSGVAYGQCKSGLVWRQGYMGDYVCVTQKQQDQIIGDNLSYTADGIGVHCP